MLTFSLPNGSSVSDRYIRYDFPVEKKKNKDKKFSKYMTYLIMRPLKTCNFFCKCLKSHIFAKFLVFFS